ncbi:MAG TPA: iron-sulfur cluster insertion protein ErpA [Gammaproteobacteria bacterium]|nr:iron-sulfur cluster insertion protein ErpA [Gammaproteobacteria bacterium]
MSALTNASNQSSPSDPITVTHSAIMKIYELMVEEDNLNLKLRIFITGGGCSGFQYGFSFEEAANDDDIIIDKKIDEVEDRDGTSTSGQHIPHIQVLVDALSLQYLGGAEVDYRKDINGERFIIRGNPNAKTTCGCGSSFSAE